MDRTEMNRFATNPVNIDISRSIFPKNHSVKFSFDVGQVIPFFVEEVLPGDTYSVDTSKVVRMQPLVAPIFDNIFLDTYYFFIPNRLLWVHWNQFMGEVTTDPWIQPVEYTVPKLVIPEGGFNVGTIADYLGIPPKLGGGVKVNALPFRAYALVCEQYFRDQNNMPYVLNYTDDSDQTGENGNNQSLSIVNGGDPFIAAKYHDYFTSCLPGTQRSSGTSVEFALNGLLPVNAYKDKSTLTRWNDDQDKLDTLDAMYGVDSKIVDGHWTYQNVAETKSLGVSATSGTTFRSTGTVTNSGYYYHPSNLFADLNSTSVFSVNELRQAFAIQKFFEVSARGGSRYTELIHAFFGVTSPDARMQRAEYLGGNRLPLNVAQVEQTSATESNLTPQGNLAAYSATGDQHSDFTKSFTENGILLGVCVARYHHTYQQGLERFWFKNTKFDFYFPQFANISEQPVWKRELYLGADADSVFGYQEAWADYRYKPSRVCGEMRSVHTTPLDMWHLADNYNGAPTLGATWIREDKTMLDRCLAVTSDVSNQLVADFYIQCEASRPMPMYSIPGLIDHH